MSSLRQSGNCVCMSLYVVMWKSNFVIQKIRKTHDRWSVNRKHEIWNSLRTRDHHGWVFLFDTSIFLTLHIKVSLLMHWLLSLFLEDRSVTEKCNTYVAILLPVRPLIWKEKLRFIHTIAESIECQDESTRSTPWLLKIVVNKSQYLLSFIDVQTFNCKQAVFSCQLHLLHNGYSFSTQISTICVNLSLSRIIINAKQAVCCHLFIITFILTWLLLLDLLHL